MVKGQYKWVRLLKGNAKEKKHEQQKARTKQTKTYKRDAG
jgi:hypothetical protein